MPKRKAKKMAIALLTVNEKYSKLRIILPAKTIGKLIKKLNLKESKSSNFLNNKAETVKPDLDKPGKTANPWTKPSRMLSELVKSFAFLYVFFFFDFIWIKAVKRRKTPIKPVINLPVKLVSIIPEKDFKRRKPNVPLIKVEMIKNLRICFSSKSADEYLNKAFKR